MYQRSGAFFSRFYLQGKPRYPTEDELAETAAVMSVLAAANRPLRIDDIAAAFTQGKRIEKRIALTILALAPSRSPRLKRRRSELLFAQKSLITSRAARTHVFSARR